MDSALLKKLFSPLCLLALGIVLLAVWMDRDREWKDYQQTYYETAARLTTDPAAKRQILEMPLEIKQILTEVDGRADRCVTCHMGVDNPRFAEMEQPYTSHPKQESFRKMLHHSLDQFGCTFCHDGQGLATSKDAAHGHVPHWDRPLLTGHWLDVGCGRCHKGTEALPGAPVLSRGRRLAQQVGCYNCHKMEGFDQVDPGAFGPDLAGVGNKMKEAWLKDWLKDPYAFASKTKMLKFYLSDEEAGALTKFLMTMKGGGVLQADSLTDVPEVARGREFFERMRCFFCHPLEGFQKKDMAPDLTGFGMKNALDLDFGYVRDAGHTLRGWLQRKIGDPRAFETKETELSMPGNDLSGEEVEALTVLLLSFSGDTVPKAYHRREDFGEDEGKRLFDELNCVGCHNVASRGIAGIGKENVAKDLSGIGDKVKVVWMFRWLKDPASIYPDTRMPTIGLLSENRALKLAEYVMGFRQEEAHPIRSPDKGKARKIDLSMQSILNGRDIFESMECYRCHRIAGKGGEIAPELSRIGEKVRMDWLLEWLAEPENYNLNMLDDRPVSLTTKQVEDLTSYLLSLEEEYGFPPRLPENALLIREEKEKPLDDLQRGKDLFGEAGPVHYLFGKRVGKMGLGCYGCHRLGDRGSNIGPDLSEEGIRVRDAWLERWLKEPRFLLPDSRMGDFHLTDDEVRSLAHYLLIQGKDVAGQAAASYKSSSSSRNLL